MKNALRLLMSILLLANSVPWPAFAADTADNKAPLAASPKFGGSGSWSRWRNVVVNNNWSESYYCYVSDCDPAQPPGSTLERGKNWVRGKLGLKTPPPADIQQVPLYRFDTNRDDSKPDKAVIDSHETKYVLVRLGGDYYAVDRSSGKQLPARFEPGISSATGTLTVRPPKKEEPAQQANPQASPERKPVEQPAQDTGKGKKTQTPVAAPAADTQKLKDPLSQAFPDSTARAIVICFGNVDTAKIDADQFRADAALGLRGFLEKKDAPMPTRPAECASLTSKFQALRDFYCDNEPPAKIGPVTKSLQDIQRQCSARRFTKAFPEHPVAGDVLKCLTQDGSFPSDIKAADVKKYGDIAVKAAQGALDDASVQKGARIDLGSGYSLGKKEKDCVTGLNKEKILLAFYCDNEPKESAASSAAQQCVDRRFEKAFPDAAERKVLECTSEPAELAGVKRQLPAAGSVEREKLFYMPALKAQALLLGKNTPAANTARFTDAELKCLKPVKDKLPAFYCSHEPADFAAQEGETGAKPQAELIDKVNQSGAGGEKGMFDEKAPADRGAVSAQPPSPALIALQNLQKNCSEQRKAEARNRQNPQSGFSAKEPPSTSANADAKKAAEDAKHAELMKNLKKDAIAGCFGAAGFGMIGFIFGGPVGAVIGAMIGFALMGAVTHLNNNPIK